MRNPKLERHKENRWAPRQIGRLKNLLRGTKARAARYFYYLRNALEEIKAEAALSDDEKLRIPSEIIVVGFPKCGTTALINAFDADQEMSVLRKPDGGAELTWPYFRDIPRTRSPSRIRSHKLSTYVLFPELLDCLARGGSDRLFVLCIRDPSRALVSWHNMHRSIATSRPRPGHFAWKERDFYAECSVEDYYRRFAQERLRYDAHFDRLLKIVGPERLVVVSQECMARDMRAVVDYLKACARREATSEATPATVDATRYRGFADRSKSKISAEILSELEKVQGNLMNAISKSNVRAFV